jgi:hypothetical protein
MTASSQDQRLPAGYAALAQRLVVAGDLRMAQLAAWAGDVHVLEELLWESGLSQAPDPAAELAAVGESVAAAIEDMARALPDVPVTARAVVEAAREALVQTFDESVHGLLLDRLGDLAQLDECRPGPGAGRETRVAARLDGRTPEALAAELRTAAGDCATMAGLLDAGGEPAAARRLSVQADAAAFEAYLVTAALAAGDESLATVDLRWELAAGAGVDRSGLATVLGTVERDALSRALEPEGTR